jgi:chemotaxis protein MotB
MGRNAWESDAELHKIGSSFRSGPTARWGRILVWIVIVAAVTFAFAYYLPLHQTHRALIEQRRQTQEAARAFEQKLHETEQQLGQAKKQNQELLMQRESRDQSQKSAAGRAEQLKKALAAKLGEKKDVTVGVDGGRVVVTLESRLLFTPPKNEVSASGRALLCAIAAASEGHALGVSALSEKNLPAGAASGWSLTAAQAAAVAQTLEEKCSVAAARLTATGRGTSPPPAVAGRSLPDNRVEIAVETSGGAER